MMDLTFLKNSSFSYAAAIMFASVRNTEKQNQIIKDLISLDYIENFQYSKYSPHYDNEPLSEISEAELTEMGMLISEVSLREDWDYEKEGHWESFL